MFVYKQSDNAANCTQIAFHSSDVMRVQTPPIALNLSALAHSLLFYLYLYLPWYNIQLLYFRIKWQVLKKCSFMLRKESEYINL